VDLFDPGAKNVLHIKTSIISSLQPKNPIFTKDVLHEKYVLKGLSTYQIAAQFASSKTTVLEALKRFEIPLRSRGACHGRPAHPPFGWKFKDGRLIEFAKEQKTIGLIRTLFVDQKRTVSAIARELSERGILTKAGKARWHHEMVRQVLKRQGLIG
jgi:hypothetical protein